MTNIFAGAFLFIAGAVIASVYWKRSEIRTLLKLEEQGTLDAADQILGGVTQLIDSFGDKKSMSTN